MPGALSGVPNSTLQVSLLPMVPMYLEVSVSHALLGVTSVDISQMSMDSTSPQPRLFLLHCQCIRLDAAGRRPILQVPNSLWLTVLHLTLHVHVMATFRRASICRLLSKRSSMRRRDFRVAFVTACRFCVSDTKEYEWFSNIELPLLCCLFCCQLFFTCAVSLAALIADTVLYHLEFVCCLLILLTAVFRVPHDVSEPSLLMGGGATTLKVVKGATISAYVRQDYQWSPECNDIDFQFVQYVHVDQAEEILLKDICAVPFNLPTTCLPMYLSVKELREVAKLHKIQAKARDGKIALESYFSLHLCISGECAPFIAIFRAHDIESVKKAKKAAARGYQAKRQRGIETRNTMSSLESSHSSTTSVFPPLPPSPELVETIVRNFCEDTAPLRFEEAGCAVCGRLCPFSDLKILDKRAIYLDLLNVQGVSRRARKYMSDPVCELEGPIIDARCKHICNNCESVMIKGKVPKLSLANGLWLGDVPEELSNLTFSERMLVARVRHNRCVMRVSSGRAKMVANAIMFANPTVTVYHSLPPSQKEMDEVLAFVFTGSAQPTEEDFKRTPMLVRRNAVSLALEWLKLNHSDYADLHISRENLETYPLSGIPVTVCFGKAAEDGPIQPALATGVHDDEDSHGTSNGPCPFTVHGLTGEEYSKLSIGSLKARALRHLESKGLTLGIGRDESPQSMFDNPQLYPQMFPWLFPYGFGGLGQSRHKRKLSLLEHKQSLLMYHDKRFQTDLYFPIIAFNHEQISAGITGSFLMAKRQKFGNIVDRLTSLDKMVLKTLTERMAGGEYVRPQTDAEKACFAVLDNLDHVGGHVKGSLTSKKYMRNEIWSLISFTGAPLWFITLSPADSRHPICLYYADTGERFSPEVRLSQDRNRLIASNPVAAARFFDLIVKSFIKNVLGVDQNHLGLYGKTAAYYGTVEQQGRLTLHLHLLLWIDGVSSPQEIRDKILAGDSAFQTDLIAYLEGVHQGELLTGTLDKVRASLPTSCPDPQNGIHTVLTDSVCAPASVDYVDPTLSLPVAPPQQFQLPVVNLTALFAVHHVLGGTHLDARLMICL